MKTRESSIPEGAVWDGFFDPPAVLRKLGLTSQCRNVADFACGHGTFSIPAARIVTGKVFAIDVDPIMVDGVRNRAEAAGVENVEMMLRDLMIDGSGLPDASVDYVMLFNILHAEDPMILLSEAHRILARGGRLGIMHWNCDPTTPRGPSMDIRPQPEQCIAWALSAGFQAIEPRLADLAPHHYGLLLERVRERPSDEAVDSEAGL